MAPSVLAQQCLAGFTVVFRNQHALIMSTTYTINGFKKAILRAYYLIMVKSWIEIQTLPFCVEFSYVYIYLKGTMYIN